MDFVVENLVEVCHRRTNAHGKIGIADREV